MAGRVGASDERGGSVNDLIGIPIKASSIVPEGEVWLVRPSKPLVDELHLAPFIAASPDANLELLRWRLRWPLVVPTLDMRVVNIALDRGPYGPPPTRWQRIKRAICRYALARWRDSGEDTRYWDGRAYSWRMLLPPPGAR